MHRVVSAAVCSLFTSLPALAADQTVPGAGNADAIDTARASDRVRDADEFLVRQAGHIRDRQLRRETLDIMTSRVVCAHHRQGLDDAQKDAIVQQLIAAGLVNPADGASITGGVKAGVFPPALAEGTPCPTPPLPFLAAPGSSTGGHHSFPGGLALHTAWNTRAAGAMARDYRINDGDDDHEGRHDDDHGWPGDLLGIDPDIVIAAPTWHDWAKTLVFQWNADGTEFKELNFGGTGTGDDHTSSASGAPGDSRTGGHHILGVAETMSRGLLPAMVIAQASAHSNPTLGNEFKVVNWLRAAAIIARIDPVARGYLFRDAAGAWHLPALRQLKDGVDLNAAGQTNLLAEYTINNLSDGDFTFSIPSIADAQVILAVLAPSFGYDPADVTRYNTRYRNVALAQLTGERILLRYSEGGLDAVRAELTALRKRKLI